MNEESIILKKRGANFFGIEQIDRKGKKHYKVVVIRGNGNLILTKEGVHFSRWVPKKRFFIPKHLIRKVDVKRLHNLKFIGWPILRIYYEEQDKTNIFGVCVGWKKDTLKWKEKIEELLK